MVGCGLIAAGGLISTTTPIAHRTGVEKLAKTFDATVMDRSANIAHWTDVCQQIVRRGIKTYVHVNNQNKIVKCGDDFVRRAET